MFRPKLMEFAGQSHNGVPARRVGRVKETAPLRTSPGGYRPAVRSAAGEPPRTLAGVRGGRGKCFRTATCVHARARGPGLAGKRDRRSALGCGPRLGVVHDSRAGRTKKWAKKILLRDHAPPQLEDSSVLAVKMGRADGAHVVPRRAALWRLRPGAAGPAAVRPASGAPVAGIRGPSSNAGSNAVADTCAHSFCGGRSAAAVAADFSGGGTLLYHERSPREPRSPKGQPGGNVLAFSSGENKNRPANGLWPIYLYLGEN
jgi:hypothetical protein